MRFVGVDLAWGERNGTGLCAADDGVVLGSTRLTTDREIVDWMEPHVTGDVLVAIDAPLIVRNLTGRRACERGISRCFGVHHASAHSSNLGMSAFREGVRGERLAADLDLSVDPFFQPRTSMRRAIEVYPHPAIVAIFNLAVSLKYKAKAGRTTLARAVAFDQLLDRLEELAGANPPLDVTTSPGWLSLRTLIAGNASGAALDRAEDEIDAYVCAYVAAYYWTHGLQRCRVVGDLESGYIVTPATSTQRKCLDDFAALY